MIALHITTRYPITKLLKNYRQSMQITVTYTAKWRLKSNHYYVFTTCKKLVNVRTGREIKKTIKGLTPGYWIGKDFIKLTDLRSSIELITKDKCPF